MRIVVDTNRIIAALIKDGLSRSILFDKRFEFFTPDYTLEEIYRYEKEIRKKTRTTHEEFELLMSILFEKIEIVPIDIYSKFMEEARQIMKVDPDDAPFVALCLALGADGIWSEDKHFLSQNNVAIFITKNLL